MAKKKKIEPITDFLLSNKYKCPHCFKILPCLPPCPMCGIELDLAVSRKTIVQISEYLNKNKGSTCEITLGKHNGKETLIYSLKPKAQTEEK